MKKLALILLSAFSVASCTSEYQVKIIRNDIAPMTIVFDGEDTLHLKNAVDSIMLKPGLHTFKWKGKDLSFELLRKDGVLNPDGIDLVKLEIVFERDGETPEFDIQPIPMSNFTIIDSFLVFEKRFSGEVETDAQRQAIVDSIKTRRNGNYAPLSDKIGRRISRLYDTDDLLHGFKKISGKNLFVEKSWDFDIGMPIPEQIEMRGRKDREKYRAEESRSCLIYAAEFLQMAQFSRNEYSVIDVRSLMRKPKP